jgi:hypothetical protein
MRETLEKSRYYPGRPAPERPLEQQITSIEEQRWNGAGPERPKSALNQSDPGGRPRARMRAGALNREGRRLIITR